MYKYFNTVTNAASGRPFEGVVVRVLDENDDLATLYSDVNGTPVEVAGQVTTDELGYYEFFVANGVYTLQFIYGGDLFKTIRDVEISADVTALALAADTGAEMVGTADGSTVQEALDRRPAILLNSFAAIAETNVAAGSTIMTAAYSEGSDKGGAKYVYDATIDAAAVAADPLWKTLTANGLGFKLSPDQLISLQMLGALGWVPELPYAAKTNPLPVDCPDDYEALQAFFDLVYLEGYHGDTGNGWYGTSQAIVAGPPDLNYRPLGSGRGNFHLVGLGVIDTLLTFQNMTGQAPWSGFIGVHGSGGFIWSDRQVNNGLKLTGHSANWGITGGIQATCFRHAGVLKNSDGGHMLWFNTPQIEAYGCGSGKIATIEDMGGLKATYSGKVNSGSAYSSAQRSTLTVSVQPPYSEIAHDAAPRITVQIGDRMYDVTAVNAGAGTITIFPWLDNAAAASGDLWYHFGGGLVEGGGDGGLAKIGIITGVNCCTPYNTFAFYPAVVDNVTTQYCGIGVWYRSSASFQNGSNISQLYTEAVQFDVHSTSAPLASSSSGAIIGNVLNSTRDLSKFSLPVAWAGVAGAAGGEGLSGAGLGSLVVLSINGRRVHGNKTVNDNNVVWMDGTAVGPKVFVGNSGTVTIAPIPGHTYHTAGIHNAQVVIVGTGANNEPTGTWTITPPTGFSINGGATSASITFSSQKAPLHLSFTYAGSGTALSVRQSRSLGTLGAAITAPTGGATVDAEARTAINSIRAALTAAGVTL